MKNLLITFAILFSVLSLDAQTLIKFKGNDFKIAGFSVMKSTLKEMEYVDYETFLAYNEKENTFEMSVVQTFGENTNKAANEVEIGAKARRQGNDKDILVTTIVPANIAKAFLEESIAIREETDMFTQKVYSVYLALDTEKTFKVKMYDRSSAEVFEYEASVGVSVYFSSKEAANAFFAEVTKAANK